MLTAPCAPICLCNNHNAIPISSKEAHVSWYAMPVVACVMRGTSVPTSATAVMAYGFAFSSSFPFPFSFFPSVDFLSSAPDLVTSTVRVRRALS